MTLIEVYLNLLSAVSSERNRGTGSFRGEWAEQSLVIGYFQSRIRKYALFAIINR